MNQNFWDRDNPESWIGANDDQSSRRRIKNLPLYRTAWRRFLRRPTQYLLLIVGVAVGVAMMVSIDLANESASRAFSLSTDAVAGRTTHRIVGGPNGLDESIYTRLKTGLGFSLAAPIVEGFVLSPMTGDQPMRLVGIDPFAEPPFRSYLGPDQESAQAGIQAFLSEPNPLLISADLAASYALELGDTINLDVSGKIVNMRLVGLLESTDSASRQALGGILFTDIASAQEIFDMVGRLSHVDLIIKDETEIDILSSNLPAGDRIEPAQARSNALKQMSSAFRLNLTALSLLALVVGMFLIYNTVTFSVVQRRRLFGILRCLPHAPRGEFILVVAGKGKDQGVWDEADLDRALEAQLDALESGRLSTAQLAGQIASASGWSRREVYQKILAIKEKNSA